MNRVALGLLLSVASAAQGAETTAASASDFLNSLGVCVHIQHGYDAARMVEPLKYLGVRNVRDGADGNYDISGLLKVHSDAGVMVAFGPGSGASDHFLNQRTKTTNSALTETIAAAKILADAGALLAVEGPNEPNNFGGVHYQGQDSGMTNGTWLPVARFQRDLYNAVKRDATLKKYPVFGSSEMGAEIDNVGLQYLTIPNGAHCLMPDGTRFADFANVHNYVCGHLKGLIDNQPFKAAEAADVPGIDGLFGNHGRTWRMHFQGYPVAALETLPKVTTETGWWTDNTPAGDDTQGKVFLNMFLDQFQAGWKYTFVYEMMDDPDGSCGFYKSDYTTARKSAVYLHNLTSILADSGKLASPGKMTCDISNKAETVHDMLLQKSGGKFFLAVWSELTKGTNSVEVKFGRGRSVKVYDPTVGTDAVRAQDLLDRVTLQLTDHPVILEIAS